MSRTVRKLPPLGGGDTWLRPAYKFQEKRNFKKTGWGRAVTIKKVRSDRRRAKLLAQRGIELVEQHRHAGLAED